MIDILKITDEISKLGEHASVTIQKTTLGYRVHCRWWQNGDFRNTSLEIDMSQADPNAIEDNILGVARTFYSQVKMNGSDGKGYEQTRPANEIFGKNKETIH